MKFTPLPHQKTAIDHLKNHRQSALFAGCGLGKTAIVLQSTVDLIDAGKIQGLLIVAPLRVANLTWSNEIEKWGFNLTFANLRTEEGVKAWHDGTAQVYAINFESLPKFCRECLDGKNADTIPAQVMVIDELSKAKNHESKRIAELSRHRDKFIGHWGLTGTPIPNSHLELFGQFHILDGGQRLGESFWSFRSKYFDSDKLGWNHWLKPGAKEAIQDRIAGMTLTLRSEDYLNIPDVNIEDVAVTMPRHAQAQYKELQEDLILQLTDTTAIETPNVMTLTGKLQQFTSGIVYTTDDTDERSSEVIHDAKVKALKKILKQEKGEPLLVATQFQHERQMILDAIPEAQLWNESTLDDWNAGKVPMLVADPRSIGHGLNLQDGGSRIVWYSLTYSSELYAQFNARLARTGQHEVTRIFRLICPGTIDDAIAEALRNKGDRQSGFLNSLVGSLRRLKPAL